jgi:hypothetical protein
VSKITVRLFTVLVLSLVGSVSGLAQLPGLPVLQNGFSNAGVTAGANYGTAEGVRGYAVAAAWAPPSARYQLSAGIGGYDPEDDETWLAYGGRFAMPLTAITGGGRFGVAPFVGIGGASREGVGLLQVPVGIAAGYRWALGQTRAMSVYLSPFYGWNRLTGDDESDSKGVFRISGGVDVALTSALGLSVGYEAGGEADPGEPGPDAPLFGIGLSYAFRR